MKNNIVNEKVLVNFVAEMAYEEVGVTPSGEPTTLAQEIATVARFIARGDVCKMAYAPDPYRQSRLAYSIAELGDEEKKARVVWNYTKAVNKILWLNSVSRSHEFGSFLTRKVNRNDYNDVQSVVDGFERAIRDAAAEPNT